MQWFRGGLVFKAHILCVSLNSRLESNKEEEEEEVHLDFAQSPNHIPSLKPHCFDTVRGKCSCLEGRRLHSVCCCRRKDAGCVQCVDLEKEFFIDNLLVRIHLIIEMI